MCPGSSGWLCSHHSSYIWGGLCVPKGSMDQQLGLLVPPRFWSWLWQRSPLQCWVIQCQSALPVASKLEVMVAHTSSCLIYVDLLVMVHKNVTMHARWQSLDLLHKCLPFWLKGKKKSATFVTQADVLLIAFLGRAGPGVKPGQRG